MFRLLETYEYRVDLVEDTKSIYWYILASQQDGNVYHFVFAEQYIQSN